MNEAGCGLAKRSRRDLTKTVGAKGDVLVGQTQRYEAIKDWDFGETVCEKTC